MAARKNGGAAPAIAGGKPVLVDIKDGIAWVTLNRPEKRNAISPALSVDMIATLDRLARHAQPATLQRFKYRMAVNELV